MKLKKLTATLLITVVLSPALLNSQNKTETTILPRDIFPPTITTCNYEAML